MYYRVVHKDTCRYEEIHVASGQRGAVSPTVRVQILGEETGFERGVRWAKSRKREVYEFISDLCRPKAVPK